MLVRVCRLFSMAIGPLLLDPLDGLSDALFGSDRTIDLLGVDMALPGIRLTLWLAGLLMVGAGVLAGLSLRSAQLLRSSPSVSRKVEKVEEVPTL
jgi:dTMP kinase